VITVTPLFVLIQGTRFGTKDELQASEAYVHLKRLGVELHIEQLDWLASVLSSAQEALEKVGGGVVSHVL